MVNENERTLQATKGILQIQITKTTKITKITKTTTLKVVLFN